MTLTPPNDPLKDVEDAWQAVRAVELAHATFHRRPSETSAQKLVDAVAFWRAAQAKIAADAAREAETKCAACGHSEAKHHPTRTETWCIEGIATSQGCKCSGYVAPPLCDDLAPDNLDHIFGPTRCALAVDHNDHHQNGNLSWPNLKVRA